MNTLFDKKPLAGFAGLKAHWKDDMLSGFMVSLIALPLCLGIALASGVPPMAGLIAAIVGGLLMSRITGSHVTISGPAAGLIVVTLGAVESMGGGDPLTGYKYALAAIVVAGVIQTIFGMLKVGKLGDFFPSAAVHGMLAAIGIIIMVKQLFVALGTKAEGHELFEVIAEIPQALVNMNPEIALIAMVSLFILVGHSKVKFKPIKMIPAPMWVIVVSIPMSHLFDLFHEHHYKLVGIDYVLGPKYLVHLPENVADGIVFPDFGMMGTGIFWIAVLSIALVSSIESLLSASAVDTLDPFKRKSNLNRDMSAMGGGSAISGLLGGLPMISEIVRSSANITNGGKTQWANFFHGGFLLLFLLFGKPIIEQIPLAALAAMLIHVGFRLASPMEFKHIREIGKAQLVIFLTTIIMVLATDLIIGIAAGIIMKFIIHLIYGAPLKYLFRTKFDYEEEPKTSTGIIHLHHAALFSNYLSLKKEIQSHHDKDHLIIDFQGVNLIDHTFRTHIHELMDEWETEGKKIELTNKDHLVPVSDHPLAARVAKKDGVISRDIKLDDHQLALEAIAKDSGWYFEPGKTMSFKGFDGFSFSRAGKIVYSQNIISGVFEDYRFIYSEVIYDTTLQTSSADSMLPALLIKNESSEKRFPVFTMEKEGFFEKIGDMASGKDIDFEDHPIFSDKFLLRGLEEDAIRAFFHPGILKLIESDPVFHVESNGQSIILYRFDQKSTQKEVKSMIKFGKKLVLEI
ncbi:MAG: SulP family inorganic anion transporter [Cyclobacteriaceae bacterium]